MSEIALDYDAQKLLAEISTSIDMTAVPQRDRERAWDRYAAAAYNAHCGERFEKPAGFKLTKEFANSHIDSLAASAALFADRLLAERDKRFGDGQ